MFSFKYWFENSRRNSIAERLNYIWYCFKRDHEILYTLIEIIFDIVWLNSFLFLVFFGIIIFAFLWVKYKSKIEQNISQQTNKDDIETLKRDFLIMDSQESLLQQKSETDHSDIKFHMSQDQKNSNETCQEKEFIAQTRNVNIAKVKCKYCSKMGHDTENCALRDKVFYEIKVKEESFKLKKLNFSTKKK